MGIARMEVRQGVDIPKLETRKYDIKDLNKALSDDDDDDESD